MAAGLYQKIKVWHITYGSDDVVGGAQPTGSVAFSYMAARFNYKMPEQLLVQQGLETEKTAEVIVHPGTNRIYERDEIELVYPTQDIYYGVRWRVVGIADNSYHPYDGRGYLRLSVVRSVEAHAIQ